MPDSNGEIPLTSDPRVDAAIERIRGKFQDLEDAMLVQAHLEKKAGERIKEHAQLIADHHEMLKNHDQLVKRIEINLAEITEKVNLLFDREMTREGGPETQL
jgi:hypothetical protein